MNSYMALIEDLLVGQTPKQQYEWLRDLIDENARARGRIDFCERQFKIIQGNCDPYTKGYIDSVLKTLSTPI